MGSTLVGLRTLYQHRTRICDSRTYATIIYFLSETDYPLLFRHHVFLQFPDFADLYLDGVAGEHVAVGALWLRPDDVD